MKFVLLVGAGSFFGGIFRYLLSGFIQGKTTSTFPYGTLAVNLIGCFIIGCLFSLAGKWQLSLEMRLLLITGLLGGFTTFSAFSAETAHLLKTDHVWMAVSYVACSVLLGIGLTVTGAWIFRAITEQ